MLSRLFEPLFRPRRLAEHLLVRLAALTGRRRDPAGLGTAALLEHALTEVETLEHRQRELDRQAKDPHEPNPKLVGALVDLAERLDELRERDLAAAPETPAKLVGWVADQLTLMLREGEVEPVDDRGELDPERHQVVGVRTTDEPDLPGTIAETVRPGYQWRGRVLRPQQVLAYVEERAR
ncbi:nucleotide exchange factor GrpE [Nonomuraea sp. NPDC050790]|uniref:nucleotide exchange factor GrpE n=1 Tax=Nonomuraea sp. NPDC050790 TaxID=3364371 RepID=UPI0037AC55F8